MQLVIGNKNYSTWSMRPWVLLRHFDIDFDEIRIPLFVPGYQEALTHYSPTLRVPVLIDAGLTIWDSLAICEYVSEKYLEGAAYPQAIAERARCRSVCSEMHSGFSVIRSQLPMNIRAHRKIEFSPEVVAECRRVEHIWTEARTRCDGKGNYLFGDFTIADCMYAPMALRFVTYGVKLTPVAQAYVESLLANSAVQAWCAEARLESETISVSEKGEAVVA